MLHRGNVLIAATRQAVLAASAAVAIASAGSAQTTYKLTIPTLWSAGAGYLGTAQVTSTPTGIDCRSEASGVVVGGGACSAEFPAGTVVTLTATPLYGGTLDGWVEACAGQGATCQLEMTKALMTSPKVIAKTFTLTLRGTGNASGLVFSVDGLARPQLHCSIEPGGVTKGTCETQYPAFQSTFLSSDYPRFFQSATRYFGCGVEPFDYSCRVVMDGPRTVLAGWVAPEIIVYGGGDGAGTVTGGTLGHFLNCIITGTDTSGACSAIWDQGPPPNSVTLTATPTGNSVFAGWSGKCSGTGLCVLPEVFDSVKVSATFTIPTHVVSITSAGSGSGKVTSNPAKLDCVIMSGVVGVGCSTLFPSGTAVTLIADPTGGSTFDGWTGECSGAQPACAIVVNADTRATARFVAPRPAAELAQALLGSLTLSGAEQRELDRFGNKDGTFNLGDLLALLARTGERLSAATMNELLAAPHRGTVTSGSGRIP